MGSRGANKPRARKVTLGSAILAVESCKDSSARGAEL